MVAGALRHFDGVRYELLAFVIMDDHAHVLVQPWEGHQLEHVVQSWKSYTANRLQRCAGRFGRVWQEEYFDRVIRDEEEFAQKARYILDNPWKWWPEIADYPWVWARGIEEPAGHGPAGAEARPTGLNQ